MLSLEDYIAENITWTPIDYFNNAIVVELLEGKRPPGLFLVLDDVCATLHGGSNGADAGLKKKLTAAANKHAHFQDTAEGFAIRHYAGVVSYSVDGFCDKNRDVLFLDLIELMQTSTNPLARVLYPPEKDGYKTKTLQKARPTTAGSKIRNQASSLVGQLMKCTPHYIRCIKPNETKKPRDWDQVRVKHQVEYLGLKENIRVRRAGFAYRRPFAKFLHRYAILTKETWPHWRGDEKQGVEWILRSVHIDRSQYQLGRSKLFIKAPESLFMLEETRDRKYNLYARIIQKAFKKYFARKKQAQQKQEAADLLFGHKERRQASLNRNFVGDYIGLETKPLTMSLVGRREKVFFAEIVKKYDRRFKVCRRDLVLTSKFLYMIGREQIKKGPEKGKSVEIIKRKLSFDQISHVSLSTLQDNFVVIHTKEDYASLMELVFKTEFLSVLSKKYMEEVGHALIIRFNNNIEYKVKKEGWGGGGTRQLKFIQIDYGDREILKSTGKTLNISIGPGLPNTTKPNVNRSTSSAFRTFNTGTTRSRPPRSTVERPTNLVSHVRSADNTDQGGNDRTAPSGPIRPDTRPTGMPTPRPVAATRTAVSPVPNGRPNIPPNRPNMKLNQFQNVTKDATIKSTNKQPNKLQSSITMMGMFTNPGNGPRGLLKFPPPPTEPPPPQDHPAMPPAFMLPSLATTEKNNNNNNDRNYINTETTPSFGNHQVKRTNRATAGPGTKIENSSSTLHNCNRTPPQKPPPPNLPKVRALYDYNPQDLDELALKEGDVIEVIKEYEGGWWHGRVKGKTGLFPSNYVEKV
ncbi:hypothetical protein KPH14_001937 [Odynerus spinipes]|uniref:Uncharacterized protein n=1 Tax=Odynerus spinipes TaxID=1348599 RepID=A0AAD9VW18_9HYME|nr:hypothetical protein KPH14_001937 [Odynerus spinipes]